MVDRFNSNRRPDFGAPRHASDVIGGARAEAMLPALRETTRGVAPAMQFEAWRAGNGNMVNLTPRDTSIANGFDAEATSWKLGPFALMAASVESSTYRRSATQIRRDSIDHWVVRVALGGERRIRSGGAVVTVRPGAAVMTSFDQPCEIENGPHRLINLYVPRDAFPRHGGALDQARHKPLETALGRVLHDYIVLLSGQLPALRRTDEPILAQALRGVVAACIVPTHDTLAAARPQIELTQLALTKRLMRQNLGLATLGPARLCRLAGISRSSLYRVCEPFGGVAKLIQTERLRQAHAALSNPADTRSIGEIAESVGLFDRSSFGRVFRQSFGCSPSELRLTVRCGGSMSVLAPAPHGQAHANLTDLLRAL